MSKEEIISDAEIDRVHGHANFGAMPKRLVVDEGVLKYAFGYQSGSTQLAILIEHGLIHKPRPGSYYSTLTKKGQRYLRAMKGELSVSYLLDMLENQSDLRRQVERLRRTLERIKAWKMPESGRTWEDGTPMSYGAAFGSNGERDLVRQWASDALSVKSAVIHVHEEG